PPPPPPPLFPYTPLFRSLADLRGGTYVFATAADRIYLADDPTGRLVEATVAPAAFRAPGVTGVVLRNLVIQKFGNPAQTGAVEGDRKSTRLNSSHVKSSY